MKIQNRAGSLQQHHGSERVPLRPSKRILQTLIAASLFETTSLQRKYGQEYGRMGTVSDHSVIANPGEASPYT